MSGARESHQLVAAGVELGERAEAVAAQRAAVGLRVMARVSAELHWRGGSVDARRRCACRGQRGRLGGWSRRRPVQVQLATIAVILFVLFVDGAINSEAWNSVCCSWCLVRSTVVSAAAAMSLVTCAV